MRQSLATATSSDTKGFDMKRLCQFCHDFYPVVGVISYVLMGVYYGSLLASA